MADTIGVIRPGPNFVLHLRARRLLDSSGNEALPSGKIERDISVANSTWSRIAGISVVADWIQDWVSDYYYTLVDEDHYEELKAEFWTEGQTWINVFYPSTASFRAGQCSVTPNDAHGIFLTDASTDDWRGTALAHELGHYMDLYHTKSSAEDCADVDKSPLDTGNLMAQGVDGRTSVPDDVHLTSCQVHKARDTCFKRRSNLVAAHIAGAIG